MLNRTNVRFFLRFLMMTVVSKTNICYDVLWQYANSDSHVEMNCPVYICGYPPKEVFLAQKKTNTDVSVFWDNPLEILLSSRDLSMI